MSDQQGKPETLWQAIARSQEPVIKSDAALERLRAGIVVAPPSRRWAMSFAWVGAAATIAGMIAVVAFVTLAAPWRQPSFRVGANEGGVGMVLAAEGEDLPMSFADGSQVVLAPGGRGRVNGLSDQGADVVLAAGSLEAHVVHSSNTRWVFHAGPFEILVTGTRFVATWQPQSQTLDVKMKEGSVQVTGGDLAQAVAVRAGQHFTARKGVQSYSLREQVPLVEASAAPRVPEIGLAEDFAVVLPATPSPPRATDVAAVVPANAPPSGDPAAGAHPAASGPARAAWATAAAAGDYGRAFALAQKRGLHKLTQRLNAADLLLLADTARFVHRPTPAADAFLALVTRFPQAPEATDAMFGLGRLAFQQGEWSKAALWFQKVSNQNSDGPLVEAALGRAMESLDRAGDAQAAAEAKRYLQRFPRGQHRALAERLLAAVGY